MKHLTPEMQQCIQNCQSCHATCLGMASTHCLEMGGAHVAPAHFKLMMDCAQICATSADFMLRGSKHHAHICAECAEICEQCAASCGAGRHGRLRRGLPRLRPFLSRDGFDGLNPQDALTGTTTTLAAS